MRGERFRGSLRLQLLRQLDRQLPLRLRHFAPKFLQIALNRLIAWVFPQRDREPSISRRQIVRCTQPCGVKRSHFHHRLRIPGIGSRLQEAHAAVAILASALAVQILMSFGGSVDRPSGLWSRARFRGGRFRIGVRVVGRSQGVVGRGGLLGSRCRIVRFSRRGWTLRLGIVGASRRSR